MQSTQSALTPKVVAIWAMTEAAGTLAPDSQPEYDVCFTPILRANSVCERDPRNSRKFALKTFFIFLPLSR